MRGEKTVLFLYYVLYPLQAPPPQKKCPSHVMDIYSFALTSPSPFLVAVASSFTVTFPLLSAPSPKKMTSTVRSSLTRVSLFCSRPPHERISTYLYLLLYGLGSVNNAHNMSLFRPPNAFLTRCVAAFLSSHTNLSLSFAVTPHCLNLMGCL